MTENAAKYEAFRLLFVRRIKLGSFNRVDAAFVDIVVRQLDAALVNTKISTEARSKLLCSFREHMERVYTDHPNKPFLRRLEPHQRYLKIENKRMRHILHAMDILAFDHEGFE